jgi:hypothetical protein
MRPAEPFVFKTAARGDIQKWPLDGFEFETPGLANSERRPLAKNGHKFRDTMLVVVHKFDCISYLIKFVILSIDNKHKFDIFKLL